jgi:hypothetical protein
MDGATFQVERLSFGDLGSQKDAGGDLPDAAEITAGKYPGNYFSADEDLDVYSFNAAAGEQYFVAVVPQAGFSSTISVQVTDEYGEALQNESFRSGKTKPFSIPSDGKYFIQLKGCCWSDGPVKYMLELKKVSASPEPLPSSVANETAGATEG